MVTQFIQRSALPLRGTVALIGVLLGMSAGVASSQAQMDPAPASPLPPAIAPQSASAPAASPSALPSPGSRPWPSLRPAKAADPVNPSYFIGPGDQLQITVAGYPEYTGAQTVLSDGTIVVPMIGSVPAAELTPAELTQELTRRLNVYLVNPVVTVSVSNLRPITVNVAGEVMRPGPIQLRSVSTAGTANVGTTNSGLISLERPTVTTALLNAGGVSREADLRQIVLKRFSPRSEIPPLTINLWSSITSDQAPRDLVLQDGDTVYVPKLKNITEAERRLMAKSSLAPRTIRVRVVGEVKQPGEVQVPPEATLSSAIAIAGGPTDKARMREVGFVRMLPDGQVDRKVMDLKAMTDNTPVQDGDLLVVPKSGGAAALDIASQILSPLGLLFNLFR
jgi:polysaccharide biosynthesis/export protein